MITQEYLRHIMTYDPMTGHVERIRKLSSVGTWYDCKTTPSSITAYGYLQMRIREETFVVHRLIWCWVTGSFPKFDIDHVDGDRLNNRWVNLRSVTRETNLRNTGIKSTNTSGVTGVSFSKETGKWHAYIGTGGGGRLNLGRFSDFTAAVDARLTAEVTMGYHPNHGRREPWRG